MAGSCSLDAESQLRALQAQYQAQGPSAATAASKIQELVESVAALQVQVGVLGERGTGVSTLVQALVGQPRQVSDPWAYFREAPQSAPEPVTYTHPIFPHLTLHDLPGFTAGESPSTYLARLGDLRRYGCLVVVVGTGDPRRLGETLRDVLRAVQQKTSTLLVRTKVDIDLHTAKRRLRSRYNPGEQLGLIRKELAEALAKERVDPKKMFLVSALETERYEFVRFEESLEEAVLSLTRNHKVCLEDSTPISQRKIKELYEICRSSSLSKVPFIIHTALEDPTDIRLDVAMVGQAGCGKSALISSLQGVGCGEPGTAFTGVVEMPRKAGPYLLPTIPQSYLWDLTAREVAGEDAWPLNLSHYDLFLLMASEHSKDAHSRLASTIASMGKEAFFIRSKTDADAEAKTSPREELQEGGQASCTGAPWKESVGSPLQVFLVSCLPGPPYDLPLLQEALQSGAPHWKRHALRRAIPTVVSHLVKQKARAMIRDAWEKALYACLSCLQNPPRAEAENLLATISSFCQELGLDEASLEHTAQTVGKAPSVLQAEIRSLFARPLTLDTLLGLITKPPSLGSWAWSYVPYFGQSAKPEAQLSFTATYGTLQRAVVELSEDAERLMRKALLEEPVGGGGQ